MTAVLVGFRSGALYPLVLIVGAAALAAAYGVLHVVAGLPDRWVSDVERCDRQRAAVNAALREGSERT